MTSFAEPDHDRALSNIAFFEKIRTENPEKFVDAEINTGKSMRSPVEDYVERDVYEATCRQGKSLVNIQTMYGKLMQLLYFFLAFI